MAVKYFCDRCAKEVPNVGYLTLVVVNRPDLPYDSGSKSLLVRKDVCRACIEDIATCVKTSPVNVG